MDMASKKIDRLSFDATLEELETIVHQLEQGPSRWKRRSSSSSKESIWCVPAAEAGTGRTEDPDPAEQSRWQ